MIKVYGTIAIVFVMSLGWLAMGGQRQNTAAGPAGSSVTAGGKGKMAEFPVYVRVATAESIQLDRTVDVTGTIMAKNEVAIASKILGKVAGVHADEGHYVPAGRVLVQLEQGDWRAQVRQARANVAVAQARLEQAEHASLRIARAKLSQSEEMLSMTKPQVDAQVKQATAKLSLDRARLRQADTQLEAARTDSRETIARAQAALDAARTRLAMLKAGGREEEKRQAAAQVESARANHDEAKRNADRAQMLLKDGAIAEADLDLAKTRLASAKALLESAVQQQRIVNEGARPEELDIARNQIKEAEAQLALALNSSKRVDIAQQEIQALQEQVRQSEGALQSAEAARFQVPMRERDVETASSMIEHSEKDIAALRASVELAKANLDLQMNNYRATSIRAPIPGKLVRRTVEQGEILTTGKVVFTLVNDEMVYFEARVAERDLPMILIGQKVPVSVDALPGQTLQGSVAELLAAGDVHSRYFTAKIALPNKNGGLKQGMFARGRIVAASTQNAVMIPGEAVMTSGDKQEVVVVNGEVAERRQVTLGIRHREAVQVLTGVNPGEQVVVSGQDQCQTGTKVVITNPADPPKDAPSSSAH